MKRFNRKASVALMALVSVALIGLIVHTIGCTDSQIAEMFPGQKTVTSTTQPVSATQPASTQPATASDLSSLGQKVEAVATKLDAVAAKTQTIAGDVQAVANVGTSVGIPYSSWLGYGAALVGAIATVYQKSRADQNQAVADQHSTANTLMATAWQAEGEPGVSPAMQNVLNTIANVAPAAATVIAAALPGATAR